MVAIMPWVSHRLSRARLIQDYKAGLVSREAVQDADFLLLAAADFHGYPSPTACPICGEKEMRTVYWVYGDELKSRAGTARSLEEIDAFAAEGLTFDLHEVEVCTSCKWNYLLRTSTVLPASGFQPGA